MSIPQSIQGKKSNNLTVLDGSKDIKPENDMILKLNSSTVIRPTKSQM